MVAFVMLPLDHHICRVEMLAVMCSHLPRLCPLFPAGLPCPQSGFSCLIHLVGSFHSQQLIATSCHFVLCIAKWTSVYLVIHRPNNPLLLIISNKFAYMLLPDINMAPIDIPVNPDQTIVLEPSAPAPTDFVKCTMCSEPTTKLCSRCDTPYCSRQCQKDDFKDHHSLCSDFARFGSESAPSDSQYVFSDSSLHLSVVSKFAVHENLP